MAAESMHRAMAAEAVVAPLEQVRTTTPTSEVGALGMEPVRGYLAATSVTSLAVTSSPPCSTVAPPAPSDAAVNKSAAETELARRAVAARLEARAQSAAGHANVFEKLAQTATSTAVTRPISTSQPQQGTQARTRLPSSGQSTASAEPAAAKDYIYRPHVIHE